MGGAAMGCMEFCSESTQEDSTRMIDEETGCKVIDLQPDDEVWLRDPKPPKYQQLKLWSALQGQRQQGW